MSTERDVIEVAIEAGQRVFLLAKGNPAVVAAYGVAAAVAAIGTGMGYAGYKYGKKVIDWFDE